jgi:hypothetical protein
MKSIHDIEVEIRQAQQQIVDAQTFIKEQRSALAPRIRAGETSASPSADILYALNADPDTYSQLDLNLREIAREIHRHQKELICLETITYRQMYTDFSFGWNVSRGDPNTATSSFEFSIIPEGDSYPLFVPDIDIQHDPLFVKIRCEPPGDLRLPLPALYVLNSMEHFFGIQSDCGRIDVEKTTLVLSVGNNAVVKRLTEFDKDKTRKQLRKQLERVLALIGGGNMLSADSPFSALLQVVNARLTVDIRQAFELAKLDTASPCSIAFSELSALLRFAEQFGVNHPDIEQSRAWAKEQQQVHANDP